MNLSSLPLWQRQLIHGTCSGIWYNPVGVNLGPNATTQVDGTCQALKLPDGSHRLEAKKSGYTFEPESISFTVPNGIVGANFTATLTDPVEADEVHVKDWGNRYSYYQNRPNTQSGTNQGRIQAYACMRHHLDRTLGPPRPICRNRNALQTAQTAQDLYRAASQINIFRRVIQGKKMLF